MAFRGSGISHLGKDIVPTNKACIYVLTFET